MGKTLNNITKLRITGMLSESAAKKWKKVMGLQKPIEMETGKFYLTRLA